MEELKFLSVKSLINNLNLDEAQEMKRIIDNKILKLKTNNIKLSLIEEYNKRDELKKYVDLIKRIEFVEVENDYIIFTFHDENDGNRYIIKMRTHEFHGFHLNLKIEKFENDGFYPLEYFKNEKLYNYLKNFSKTISNAYFPEYEKTIISYLTGIPFYTEWMKEF